MANPFTAFMIRPLMQRRNAKKLTLNTENSINEASYVTLGGIEQWVTVRGQNRENPVLLLLHGGPGSPYTAFSSWLTEWEKHFTIVQWDQRGGGKTYQKHGEDGSQPLTIDQLATDGIELAEYLCQHLDKQKIILVGSSVGSLVGVHIIRKRPDLFYAYVGTEQNSPGGLSLSYELTKTAAEQAHNKKGLALLTEMGAEPTQWSQKQYEAMNKLSIAVSRDVPDMVYDIMLPALLFTPDYTMNDIKSIQKGMEFSMRCLFPEIVAFNTTSPNERFDLPFFIFQGEGDILTPVATAEAYLDSIDAPKKAFVRIEHAGHLAAFCNPDQFLQALLQHIHPLATTKN